MLKVTTAAVQQVRPTGLGRLRYQLLVGLLLAVAMPVVLRAGSGLSEFVFSPSGRNTLLACIASLVGGIVVFRRLVILPGVLGYAYTLPSFGFSYLGIAAVLLLFKADYVRSVFIASLAISIGLFFFVSYRESRRSKLVFAIVPDGDVDDLTDIETANWTFLTDPTQLPQAVAAIVADFRANLSADWVRLLADATLAGIPVFHVKQMREVLTGRVELEHLSENSFGSLIPNNAYMKVKRLIDFTTALIALPIVVIVLVICGVLIKLDSPGPVLFRQQRTGYRGKPFVVIKLRTMAVQPADKGDLEAAMTQVDDARITRLGGWLRRTRIDELPQLFNVLRGEMSWIGPRPEAVPLSSWYEQQLPFYSYRHAVPPGISGWAQVNQGYVTGLSDVHLKLGYDFYYIKYFSLSLDALVFLRTIITVVTGFGSK